MSSRSVEYDISKYDRVTIGKSDRCDIRLDNPYISRMHAAVYFEDGHYYVEDLKSANGTYLNGKKIGNRRILENGDLITIRENTLSFAEGIISIGDKLSKAEKVEKVYGSDAYPHDYRRTPRLKKEMPRDIVEIDSPPSAVGTPETNWFSVLASPVIMILIMVAMCLLSFASPSMMIFTIPMSVLSIVMVFYGHSSQKKNAAKSERLRDKKYTEYLDQIEGKIRKLKKKQIVALQQDSPSLQECLNIILEKENRLWSKRPSDNDFLSVRIGSGICDATFEVHGVRDGFTMEEDHLVDRAKEIAENAKQVQGSPVECDLRQDRLIGVLGKRRAVINMGKNMIVELTTMHSYEDVLLVVLAKEQERAEWDFMKWFPHTFDSDRKYRYYAAEEDDIEETLKRLEEILKMREMRTGEKREVAFSPSIVVLVTDIHQLSIQPTIWKYIFERDNLGVYGVLLFNEMDKLPKECNTIIEVSESKGRIFSKNNTDKKTKFVLEHIRTDLNEYEKLARAMAPIRSIGGAAENTLPKNLTFFEGYGIKSAEEFSVGDSWKKSQIHRTMAVPIGVKGNGDTYYLDIIDNFSVSKYGIVTHGPHGMIAGTTGSGKTETIQTWILSMALHFSPQEISFVLIDFKGANLLLPFANLPHVAGTISDLDETISRNQIALESEMNKRKRLFAEQDVADIMSYHNKYHLNNGEGMENIPYLFIIIDEFAEFKQKYPDYIPWIESIYAIGRTLGVFMIVMTQKPDGTVTDKMEANARFRICLKTQSEADSKTLLKRPDAAYIVNPGRAYIRVGEDEMYDAVQTYYCNAKVKNNDIHEKEYHISIVDSIGNRLEYKDTSKSSTSNAEVKIEERAVLLERIEEYVKENNISAAMPVWTERLDSIIALDDINAINYADRNWSNRFDGFSISVGMIDDPYNQTKYPLILDFVKNGHVVVYGSPQSGKTTFIESVIMATVKKYTPNQVNIYGLDFGSHILEGLFGVYPHVGGIASDIDEKKLDLMMSFIMDTFEKRKTMFSKEGVNNLATYCQVSGNELPYILIVIDRYEVIKEEYSEYDDALIHLSSMGGSYGIYIVASAGNTNAIGYKMSQNVKTMMAMQLTDPSDYADIVGRTAGFVPETYPGRGLIAGPLEFQAALPVVMETEAENIKYIKGLGHEMSEAWDGSTAVTLDNYDPEVKKKNHTISEEDIDDEDASYDADYYDDDSYDGDNEYDENEIESSEETAIAQTETDDDFLDVEPLASMEGYKLDGPQMYYLAQHIYASQIYGVVNPFEDVNVDDEKEMLLEASKELKAQSLVYEDFDGNVVIKPDLKGHVQAYTNFDAMLLLKVVRNGRQQIIHFFARDEKITYLKSVGDMYVVGPLTLEELSSYVDNIVSAQEVITKNSDVQTQFASYQTIVVQTMIDDNEEDEALELLIDGGCEREYGELYIKALKHELDSTSFTLLHDPMYNIPDEEISYLQDGNKLIGLGSEIGEDLDEYTVLSETTTAEVLEKIQKCISEFILLPEFNEDTGSGEDSTDEESDE